MKKLYYLMMAMAATLGCTSCNNEWEDEQFDQMVSFKAVLNDDGVCPLYVRYDVGGMKRYELPIFLSGSTVSTSARTVHVAVDPDTLETLNEERFGRRDYGGALAVGRDFFKKQKNFGRYKRQIDV